MYYEMSYTYTVTDIVIFILKVETIITMYLENLVYCTDLTVATNYDAHTK